MTASTSLPMDAITDDDIAWVCEAMRLPKNAFSGPDGKDQRKEILCSLDTLDVEACPGSGKTTLLVAKLAIMARKWRDPYSGICVLSHTNVARREIERLLGSTPAGRRLLSYPHFVGTIHNFADHFLALPLLRSRGNPLRAVDDERCEAHRRRLLKQARFAALATFVKNKEEHANVVGSWRVSTADYDVVKDNGEPQFKDASGSAATQLKKLAQCCAEDGYFRYSEMFTWAEALLESQPQLRGALRVRFPIVFIDEVQDNSEGQSAFLHRVFTEGTASSVRQRFGDANQAIFNGDERPASGVFPDPGCRRDIESSHRFGQDIANLAAPLAFEPQALVGRGPTTARVDANASGQHTIFLFDNGTIDRVVPAFAEHLLTVFSEDERDNGDFVAVGAVHRPGDNKILPRSIKDYWPEYDHELTGADSKPRRLLQYCTSGRRATEVSSESHHLVDRFAEGMLRLTQIARPGGIHQGWRRRRHRQVLDALALDAEGAKAYVGLVRDLVLADAMPSESEWTTKWVPAIGQIVQAMTGSVPSDEEAVAFLAWEAKGADESKDTGPRQRDNVFRYPADDPKVKIRMGSIHSAKGETHTATLVLETHFHEPNLGSLKPWLLGTTVKKSTIGTRNKKRLKEHYVAMTRPSHLLCLAMREDVFNSEEIATLKSLSWQVVRMTQSVFEQL